MCSEAGGSDRAEGGGDVVDAQGFDTGVAEVELKLRRGFVALGPKKI